MNFKKLIVENHLLLIGLGVGMFASALYFVSDSSLESFTRYNLWAFLSVVVFVLGFVGYKVAHKKAK